MKRPFLGFSACSTSLRRGLPSTNRFFSASDCSRRNPAAVVSHNAAEPAPQPDMRNKPDTDQMRQAHERRLAMLRARTHKSAPEPDSAISPEKPGTRPRHQ
jgi:hypothetical protein